MFFVFSLKKKGVYGEVTEVNISRTEAIWGSPVRELPKNSNPRMDECLVSPQLECHGKVSGLVPYWPKTRFQAIEAIIKAIREHPGYSW